MSSIFEIYSEFPMISKAESRERTECDGAMDRAMTLLCFSKV